MLLFLGGATAAVVGTAFYTGALDPLLGTHIAAPPPEVAKSPPPAAPAEPEAAAPEAPKPETSEQPQQQAAISTAPEAAPKPEQPPAASQAEPLPPSFDILRVEPDGSIVIAGKASPNAEVEILSGSKVLGRVTATGEGDFAAALDERLKPGDYQIVLRSTTTSRIVANSKETAVVSIPDTKDGQVLALVEQPGAPSRLITKPEALSAPVSAEQPPAQAAQPAAPEPAPQGQASTAEPAPAAPAPKAARPAPAANVAVDAVEIEGRKVFVAGSSDPGKTVRIYANDILLGDAKTSPEGRFLIETEKDLPVGDYVFRADVLGPDGAKVIARAAVPFTREPGENISAVAPQPQAAPAPPAEPEPAPPTPADNTASAQQPTPAPDAQSSPDTATEQPTVAAQPQAPASTQTQNTPSQSADQPQQQAVAPEGAELAPKLKPVDGAVIIRRGDSLWRISKRVYGRGMRYSTIYLANQEQIKDPDMIWPGQVFRVPDETEQGEKADMDAIEKPAPATAQ